MHCGGCGNSDSILRGGEHQGVNIDCSSCGNPNMVIITYEFGEVSTDMSYITHPRLRIQTREGRKADEKRYGPRNIGPLHATPACKMDEKERENFSSNCLHGIYRKSVAHTFNATSYEEVSPKKGTYLILIRDQNDSGEESIGSFFSLDHERSRDASEKKGHHYSSRYDYSIPAEWNSLLSSQIVIVPRGILVWRGTSAPLSHVTGGESHYHGGGEQIFLDRETARFLWQATQKWLEGDRRVINLDRDLVEKAKENQKAFLEKVRGILSIIRIEKSKEIKAEKEFEKERVKYEKASQNLKNIGRSRIQSIYEEVEKSLLTLIRRMRADPILKNSAILSRARSLLKELRAAMKVNSHLILLHEGPNSKWRVDCNARTSRLMKEGNRIAHLPVHIRSFLGHERISSEKELPTGWITIHTEEIEGVNRRLRVRFEWSHDETIVHPDGKSKTTIHWYNVIYEWQ